MGKSVTICEVGPRDGLQNQKQLLTTEAKIEFVERSIAAGIKRIEVTSFVNPKRVPQMADADQVMAGLKTRWKNGITYIGLAVNKKGADRAIEAGCNEIGYAMAASQTFNIKNAGMSVDDGIAQWKEIRAETKARGLRATATFGTSFGCPFEGEISPDHILDLCKRVADADEVALADTVGVGVPTQVLDLFGRLREAVPGVPMRAHFHNTRNTGFANAYAAVEAGVQTLDASIGGIGGCPFAPRATGNISTEDLVYMLNRMGVETGVDIEQLIDSAVWIEQQLGTPVPSMLAKAGNFPPKQNAAQSAA
jgi:hydroxymethylglutaryl-CoA lyase